MSELRGVVYMMKRRGPRTEPCGTPQKEVWREEKLLAHFRSVVTLSPMNCGEQIYSLHLQPAVMLKIYCVSVRVVIAYCRHQ